MEVLPSGHPIAEVALDGSKPLRFIIDTAASSTSILPCLRAAMPSSMFASGSQNLDGAAGKTQIETLTLKRLTVDGRTFDGLTAFALPPSPVDELGVDGVLGADVIARFAVEMDMPGRVWRMTDAPTEAMLKGMLPPVPITLDEALTPRLTVHLDGTEIPAILDTGAKGTIMNWAAARLLGLTPDSPGVIKASTVKGVTTHGTASVTNTFRELRIGQASRPQVTLRIADLPVFTALGFAEGQPALILGIDILADRRFVIDHPGKRLFLSKTTGGS
ncbi:aspartyl protease family protein [Sphingomonas edaphi]|nr:aspartyl protease family protein [Sphingomonas edaphi]